MPHKTNKKRRNQIPKSSYRVSNWHEYNEALKQRGSMTIWLSQDAINGWYEKERIFDGTGRPNLYSWMAIVTSHEIRQVFKLPLRQCEGFINLRHEVAKGVVTLM